MSRFALQKCSNLAQMLLANLLIARVISSCGLLRTNVDTENEKKLLLK